MPKIGFRKIRSRGTRPDWSALRKEVSADLDRRVKPEMVALFDNIVADWDHRPAFRARKSVSKTRLSVYAWPVGPYAKIWKWVSVTGTDPHTITPSLAKHLVFNWNGPGSYRAHTAVDGSYDGPGESTGPVRRQYVVEHPGFPPRNFERHIADKYRKTFNSRMEVAFKRGIRRSKALSK